MNRGRWWLSSLSYLLTLICPLARAESGRDWTRATAAAPWYPRAGHTSIIYNGRIWVIGGESYTNHRPEVWYSANGTTWTLANRYAPWDSRVGHSSVVYAGKMWLIGGRTYEVKNDVWYSTNGTIWTQATAHAPWAPRVGHGSVVFNGKMWVIGGVYPDHLSMVGLNDVWYSTNGVSWTCVTAHAQFSPRGVAICFVYDGRIWLIGGDGGLFKDVWCSSNGTTWSRVLAEGPWRGYIPSGVVAGGKMWVMGGTAAEWWDAFSVSDVWCSKDGVNWTQVTPQAAWIGRERSAIVVHNRRMWILGGKRQTSVYDPLIFLNDVWYSEIPTDTRPSWKLYR